MRGKSFLVALALFGAVVSGGPAARAENEVHCVNEHDLVFSPGLSIQGNSGSFRETAGTMECEGPINGRTPTGVGSYRDSGRYGIEDPDTCHEGGEGDGVFSSIVPTGDGDQELTAAYTFTYGDMTSHPGAVSGEFHGKGVRGVFQATPLEGDCIITPLTRVRVKAEFFFAQSFFTR